jgi:hypothetical protein
MLLDKEYAYFGPVADQMVGDAGQFDGFRVISPEPFQRGPGCCVEIGDQAASISRTMPGSREKDANPRSLPGDRGHPFEGSGGRRHCLAISALPTSSPSSFWSSFMATVTRSKRPVNSNGAS